MTNVNDFSTDEELHLLFKSYNFENLNTWKIGKNS